MRLGNAPTVLSALTGAWALYGGEPFQVAGVGVAIVVAYIGGMLLNDVFDLPFDQLHHPDRPLPCSPRERDVYDCSLISD